VLQGLYAKRSRKDGVRTAKRLHCVLPSTTQLHHPPSLPSTNLPSLPPLTSLQYLSAKMWWKLRGIPRPPGSLPFLGHALAIGGKGAPWDTMLGWVRMNCVMFLHIFQLPATIFARTIAHDPHHQHTAWMGASLN
jgi:hypothetical protein